LKNNFNKRKKQIKRINVKLKKKRQHKLSLEDEIESYQNFSNKIGGENLKIKRIRTEMKKIIYEKL
jgi:hypothetical protein